MLINIKLSSKLAFFKLRLAENAIFQEKFHARLYLSKFKNDDTSWCKQTSLGFKGVGMGWLGDIRFSLENISSFTWTDVHI